MISGCCTCGVEHDKSSRQSQTTIIFIELFMLIVTRSINQSITHSLRATDRWPGLVSNRCVSRDRVASPASQTSYIITSHYITVYKAGLSK